MTKIDLPTMIKFHFIHRIPGEPRLADKLFPSMPAPFYGTVCHIVDTETSEIISTGHTYLHPGDNFNRALGRKIAAARAIKSYAVTNSEADRAIRRFLWDHLFTQSPKTRRAKSV